MRPFRWAFAIASLFAIHGWIVDYHEDVAAWAESSRGLDYLLAAGEAFLAGPSGLALALFARVKDHDMLESANRRRIHDYVAKNPASSISEIATNLRLGWGTAIHHLERLESANLIRSRMDGRRRAFMVEGPTSDVAHGYLARTLPARARLFEAVRASPGLSQGELAARAGLSLPLAHRHLRTLEKAGFVVSRKTWRSRTYDLAQAATSQFAQTEFRHSHPLSAVSPRGTSIG